MYIYIIKFFDTSFHALKIFSTNKTEAVWYITCMPQSKAYMIRYDLLTHYRMIFNFAADVFRVEVPLTCYKQINKT
jgi:hypothetical protein